MCFGSKAPPAPPPPPDPVLPAQPIIQQQPIGLKAGRTEEDDKFKQTKAQRARKKLRIQKTESVAGVQVGGQSGASKAAKSSGVQV